MPDPAPITKANLRVVLRNLPFVPIWQIGDTTMLQGDIRRVAGGCFRGTRVDGRDDSSDAYNYAVHFVYCIFVNGWYRRMGMRRSCSLM
ncbi:hypothetical protein CIB48_g9668 [Xylaria polymorpha]|nr:hypothetical protein CIB48_g9668 [Xylaria polymorpha]